MMAASQAKLPPTSESPSKPAPAPSRALAGKGADKKQQQLINLMQCDLDQYVFQCTIRLQANRLGSADPQNNQERLSMYSAIVSMCTYEPFQNVKNAVPKFMYLYVHGTSMYPVHTGTYHFMTLKYVLGTYFLSKVCTRKHTFNTKYVLVCTWYILMYPVHTLGKKYEPGTDRSMSVYIGTIP
jgi:hypothetical protein